MCFLIDWRKAIGDWQRCQEKMKTLPFLCTRQKNRRDKGRTPRKALF
jgi:hypothetical protein